MISLRRFFRQPKNLLALTLVGLFFVAAIFAPILAPSNDPSDPDPYRVAGRFTDRTPHPPSAEAPLGTTPGQFDIYHGIIWGTRSALRFGLFVAVSTALIGIVVGAISGYVGGWANTVSMRFTDAFLAFPAIAGVWLLRQVLPNPDSGLEFSWFQEFLVRLKIDPVMATLIIFSWMAYARLININVIQIKQSDHVLAAQAIGVGKTRILIRHILPAALPPAIVLLARDVGAFVLLESAFTFIGVGGVTEWGNLLVLSRDWVIGSAGNPFTYWWTFVPISLTLIFFGFSWNLLGDRINDHLNPRHGERSVR
ncbi:MAG: ABC transporter permease [Caldilineales bacterium]|nr:ABC transporter permease [Caldilineales bacterium]